MLTCRELRKLPGVFVNSSAPERVCGILNVGFRGADSEILISSLKDVAVSSGSACTSASVEPSYVLTAIGLKRDDAYSSLRFSLGRFTTGEEIDFVFRAVTRTVAALK